MSANELNCPPPNIVFCYLLQVSNLEAGSITRSHSWHEAQTVKCFPGYPGLSLDLNLKHFCNVKKSPISLFLERFACLWENFNTKYCCKNYITSLVLAACSNSTSWISWLSMLPWLQAWVCLSRDRYKSHRKTQMLENCLKQKGRIGSNLRWLIVFCCLANVLIMAKWQKETLVWFQLWGWRHI